jgi:hypothetical protein
VDREQLTTGEVEHFLRHGYVVVKECFNHSSAQEWIDRAWLLSWSKGSASAQQVFDGKPLQAGESVALGAGSVDVEIFERAAVL